MYTSPVFHKTKLYGNVRWNQFSGGLLSLRRNAAHAAFTGLFSLRRLYVAGTLSSTNTNYVSGIGYTAAGGLSQMTLGNGLSENFSWNDRSQQTGVQALKSGTSLLTLAFYPCPNGGITCSNNNGNILGQAISAAAMPNILTQSYVYDNLNRIASFMETANSATNLAQTFSYDIYGNRKITARTNLTVSPWEPSTFNAANNRIANAGWVYDNAGNVIQTPNNQTIAYDAEGRQTQFCTGSNCTQYVYDGEGRRVEKIDPGGTSVHIFVYMQDGQMAAEYTNAPPVTPLCTTCYLTWDHLGSTRLVTDGSGNVVERHDFLPFGEEIAVSGATDPRYGAGYSGSSWLTRKFTGAERDYESLLDFLQARYLASMQGRFLSPDPHNAGAHPTDPQTWNAYAYVGNNPLRYTDPSGRGFWSVFDDIVEGVVIAGLGGIFNGFAAGWTVGLEVTAIDAANFVGNKISPGLGQALDLAITGILFGPSNIFSSPPIFSGGGTGFPSDQPWSEQLPSGIGSTTLGARVGVPTGTWGGNSGGLIIQNFQAVPVQAISWLEEAWPAVQEATGAVALLWGALQRSQASQQQDEAWAKDQARRICGQPPSREAQRRAWEDASKHGMPRGPRDRSDLLNDLLDTMRGMGECRGR